MKTLRQTSRLAISLLLAVLLASCGGDSPEKLIASAKTYLARNELRSATIQLRNALQKAPENGEARYLFGTTLLDAGDPVSAEKIGRAHV